MAQGDGSFGITVGGNLLMGELANSNDSGFEIGLVSKVPIAEQGLIKTLVTGISYIKLPWSEDITDPERSDRVICTFVGAMAGNTTGLNVFGGGTINFGMFDQGYLGAEIGAGYAMEIGGINEIVEVSLRYSAFNAINKIKDWDLNAVDLFRFNVSMTI